MTTLLDQMIRIADERGMESPEGLTYGFRSVRPDFTSKNGFRWAFPGQWSEAEGPIITDNKQGCPWEPGDGICVASSWSGMASGGIPALNILLVGYHADDVLGTEQGGEKVRVRRAFVRDLIDGQSLLLKASGANLQGANLQGVNLQRADLQGVNLQRADLQGVNLQGVNLQGVNLQGADLRGAYLQGADLRVADLRGAYLQGVNLQRADLQGADLRVADLRGAYLQGAYLRGANLRGADLRGATMPEGFNANS